jgi:hypothetical protein
MLFDWLIVGQAFTAGLPASYLQRLDIGSHMERLDFDEP